MLIDQDQDQCQIRTFNFFLLEIEDLIDEIIVVTENSWTDMIATSHHCLLGGEKNDNNEDAFCNRAGWISVPLLFRWKVKMRTLMMMIPLSHSNL